MALYNRGVLSTKDSVASPAYRTAAQQHFAADVAPVRRQAMEELADEYAGRGLSGSGMAAKGRLNRRGDFMQQLAQNRQRLGLQQANLSEGERQRLEGREWQLEDMKKQQALEDEFNQWEADDYAAAKDMAKRKAIFNAIGKIVGQYAGSQMPSGGGNAMGRNGFSSDELSRISVRPDTGSYY